MEGIMSDSDKTVAVTGDSNSWVEAIDLIGHRFLQDNSSSTCRGSATSLTDDYINNSEILRNSLQVYGALFVFGFTIYCILRKKIPRTYAVRQWVPGIKTPLAENQFGYISWLWRVYSFSTDELLETIGLDALCFLRLMNMGFRLACVGAFNSIWLMPVYGTAERGEDHPEDDNVGTVSINGLKPGSPRFMATVLACYIFYGFTFYTILKEFRWFIKQRHIWLRKFNQRNYTIFVRNIPEDMRSDQLLLDHFQRLYGKERVLVAHVCLLIPGLQSLVAKRKTCVANLEHALAELAINGKRPRHWLLLQAVGSMVGGKRGKKSEVDSIDYYTEELDQLNTEINTRIDMIERKQRPKLDISRFYSAKTSSLAEALSSDVARSSRVEISRREHDPLLLTGEQLDDDGIADDDQGVSGNVDCALEEQEVHILNSKTNRTSMSVASESSTAPEDSPKSSPARVVKKTILGSAKKKAKQVKKTATGIKESATSVLSKTEDGVHDDAGFVTFKSLAALYAALQMSQHATPFVFDTRPCPGLPRHIYWSYVGKDQGTVQVGRLISLLISVALCFFWTFIVAFIVNLTNVDHLKNEFPQLGKTLENNPWMTNLLALISPVLLLIFNSGLLPIILKAVSRFEFPASDGLLEASAFWKMAAFTVIQTFFVSLISGSVIQELTCLAQNPGEFVNLLGTALPEQGGYFMQLLIVSTCVGTLLELFRVVPLFQAAVRANIGWRLTAKERSQEVGPMKPISVVDKIYFSRLQSRFLLYFMVMLVYSSISPLVNWFCLAFFLLLGSVYRHQFVFNYPGTPDSGGEIWLYFVRVLLACIVIAQLALVGFLGLKKATIALPLMVPLMIATYLFILYLNQEHFTLGRYLPARNCLVQDIDNEDDGVDYSEFKNDYKNPALMARVIEVDWDSGKAEAQKRKKQTVLFQQDEESQGGIGHVDVSQEVRSDEDESGQNEEMSSSERGACVAGKNDANKKSETTHLESEGKTVE